MVHGCQQSQAEIVEAEGSGVIFQMIFATLKHFKSHFTKQIKCLE